LLTFLPLFDIILQDSGSAIQNYVSGLWIPPDPEQGTGQALSKQKSCHKSLKKVQIADPDLDLEDQFITNLAGSVSYLTIFVAIDKNMLPKGSCAAHIGMDGMRIEKEPRQKDEYVYRTS
jgi:hypothetical protein